MQPLLFFLLAFLSTSAQTGSAGTVKIDTRYGVVDVAENPDTVAIRFQGKVLSTVEALGASLYRITPKDEREFVIVDNFTSGLHCHHVFVLVELDADGKVSTSEPFGVCKELEGVEFHGDAPVIRLREPYIPGQRKSSVSATFEWRSGKIVELPGS